MLSAAVIMLAIFIGLIIFLGKCLIHCFVRVCINLCYSCQQAAAEGRERQLRQQAEEYTRQRQFVPPILHQEVHIEPRPPSTLLERLQLVTALQLVKRLLLCLTMSDMG